MPSDLDQDTKELISVAMRILGQRGGRSKSPAKQAASRRNGKLRKLKPITPEQQAAISKATNGQVVLYPAARLLVTR